MGGEEEAIELRGEFAGADLERLVLVGGDLEYLKSLPRDRLLTHTEVRLAASVLRRLLIDRQLPSVWRAFDNADEHPLLINAPEVDTALNAWPTGWVRYAYAGGASAGKGLAHHTGMVLAVIPKAEHEPYGSPEAFMRANPLPIKGEGRLMTVKTWLASTSVAILTNEIGLVRVSRQSVVTYVANRRGGVHFDPARDVTLPRNPRKHRREVESVLLDHGLLRVGHLSGPEFEIMSMVQALTDADWCDQLIRIAQDAAPADFGGNPSEVKFWAYERQEDGTGWATLTYSPPQPEAGDEVDP